MLRLVVATCVHGDLCSARCMLNPRAALAALGVPGPPASTHLQASQLLCVLLTHVLRMPCMCVGCVVYGHCSHHV